MGLPEQKRDVCSLHHGHGESVSRFFSLAVVSCVLILLVDEDPWDSGKGIIPRVQISERVIASVRQEYRSLSQKENERLQSARLSKLSKMATEAIGQNIIGVW